MKNFNIKNASIGYSISKNNKKIVSCNKLVVAGGIAPQRRGHHQARPAKVHGPGWAALELFGTVLYQQRPV